MGLSIRGTRDQISSDLGAAQSDCVGSALCLLPSIKGGKEAYSFLTTSVRSANGEQEDRKRRMSWDL